MKSALVVSYVSYLTFSAINAQENQSISIYNTSWFQVDNEQAIRCVYDADMSLQETEYYSNSTIGAGKTDHVALEHCYREYCTERNDNYYILLTIMRLLLAFYRPTTPRSNRLEPPFRL